MRAVWRWRWLAVAGREPRGRSLPSVRGRVLCRERPHRLRQAWLTSGSRQAHKAAALPRRSCVRGASRAARVRSRAPRPTLSASRETVAMRQGAAFKAWLPECRGTSQRQERALNEQRRQSRLQSSQGYCSRGMCQLRADECTPKARHRKQRTQLFVIYLVVVCSAMSDDNSYSLMISLVNVYQGSKN